MEQQEAPLKNTDHAFVQVGHNGEPIVPKTGEEKNDQPGLDKQVTAEKMNKQVGRFVAIKIRHTMDKHNLEPDRKKGKPDEAYRQEWENKGSTFTDTPTEADARDKAKVEKALSGETQKMDSVHPDELQDDNMDEIRRETLDNK